MNKCKAPVLGITINRVMLQWMTPEYSFSRLRKIRRRSVRDRGSERGRGTTKQPAFGILCRNGTVWAEIVDDVGSDTLQSLISQKVSAGSIVCSDSWKAYNGIVSRGYVHRLVNHGKNSTSIEKEIISMAGRDSRYTWNENWYRKVVSDKKNSLST